MDDHIYNNKLITHADAANYLQEVATLKLRCLPTNIPALQVIEKLTRFMNLILNEDAEYHTNSHNQSFQMTNQIAGSASPVYSLPDEDRNIDSEQNNIEDLNITNVTDDDVINKEMDITNAANDDATHKDKDSNEQINTANKSQVRHSTYAKSNDGNIDVIDITNDTDEEDIQGECNEQLVSIERVNTGMSTMTLQDNVGSEIQCDDNNCSQSILDNYDNDVTNETSKEKDIHKVKMVVQDEINATTRTTSNIDKDYQINTPLSGITSNKIADPKLMISQSKTAVDVTMKPTEFKGDTDKGKKVTNKNDNKLKKRRTKKNKESKVDSVTQTCLDITMSSKRVVDYNGKEKNPKNIKKPKKHEKVHEIYNENVENDLSWVENLRYVREISPSEYDPGLNILQDNFWNNFQLPGTWDDLDFNV
ncbi:uncharacterized protein LOC125228082 [Leguminivora glycinivorella]|uniref:uncharacterized protein LOC125228082 n=1 Tax=Leguminivora glycinivorella TaxID=1035111 RepID=UPI00200CB266|nr:uncharacterized protein LOC125228082 [Leguminivora glycinivorella]